MGMLDDIMAEDAAQMLDQFGEAVTYVKANGTTRVVQAIVDREKIDNAGAAVPKQRPSILITVATNSTTGILPGEINRDADHVLVRYLIGAEPQRFSLSPEIVTQDAGMWQLRLR